MAAVQQRFRVPAHRHHHPSSPPTHHGLQAVPTRGKRLPGKALLDVVEPMEEPRAVLNARDTHTITHTITGPMCIIRGRKVLQLDTRQRLTCESKRNGRVALPCRGSSGEEAQTSATTANAGHSSSAVRHPAAIAGQDDGMVGQLTAQLTSPLLHLSFSFFAALSLISWLSAARWRWMSCCSTRTSRPHGSTPVNAALPRHAGCLLHHSLPSFPLDTITLSHPPFFPDEPRALQLKQALAAAEEELLQLRHCKASLEAKVSPLFLPAHL